MRDRDRDVKEGSKRERGTERERKCGREINGERERERGRGGGGGVWMNKLRERNRRTK